MSRQKIQSLVVYIFLIGLLFYAGHRFAPESPLFDISGDYSESVDVLDLVDSLHEVELDFAFVQKFVSGKQSYSVQIPAAPSRRGEGRDNPFSTIQTPFRGVSGSLQPVTPPDFFSPPGDHLYSPSPNDPPYFPDDPENVTSFLPTPPPVDGDPGPPAQPDPSSPPSETIRAEVADSPAQPVSPPPAAVDPTPVQPVPPSPPPAPLVR